MKLAKKIKDSNLNYKIILTLNGKENSAAKKILDEIKKYNLENFVKNGGGLFESCKFASILMDNVS